MRRQGLGCANLSVFVWTNEFTPAEPQYFVQRSVDLPVVTADTDRPLRAAQVTVGSLWRQGFRYKKAGVMLLDLVDEGNDAVCRVA